jgi:hypothetical protein
MEITRARADQDAPPTLPTACIPAGDHDRAGPTPFGAKLPRAPRWTSFPSPDANTRELTQQHTTCSGDWWECSERDGDVKLARRATNDR